MATGAWPAALRSAFLYHWNLLFLGVSGALALLSGRPDVVLPLAGAAEIAYLALLSTNPRFQNLASAIDRGLAGSENAVVDGSAEEILRGLTPADRARYQALAERCTQLRRLAAGDAEQEPLGIPDLQLQNIDRLLRILLRLLGVKGTLERFFSAVDKAELTRDLERARKRLTALESSGGSPARVAKSRAAVQDTCSTIEMRLKNLATARENYEYVLLELERLHTKIAGIAELGIDRQDADSVGREIDLVTSSVEETEQTMRDIEGLARVDFGEAAAPDSTGPPRPRGRLRN